MSSIKYRGKCQSPYELLKGYNIVFTGQFTPYNKDDLTQICTRLGAKCPSHISRYTSALIQGSYIQDFFGKPQLHRDINETNKTVEARSKGVRVVANEQMNNYFISITGFNISELTDICDHPQSYSQRLNYSQNQSIQKSAQSNLLSSKELLTPNIQEKEEQKPILDSNREQKKQKISDFYSSSSKHTDNQKLAIKKQPEKLEKQPQTNQYNAQNPPKQSSFDCLLKSFNSFRQACQNEKIEYFESYFEIKDKLKETFNVTNDEIVKQKITQLEKLTEKCFNIYRNLNKNLNLFQQKAFDTQKKEHQENYQTIINSLVRDKKGYSYQVQPQKMSKSEQLQRKKQRKQEEHNKRQIHEYLSQKFSSKDEIQKRYRRMTETVRNSYPAHISFSPNCYELDHHEIKVDIQDLIKYNWKDVEKLNLNKCVIDSRGWKLLTENASAFKNLKFLTLSSNNINDLNMKDLQKFSNLKVINFGFKANNANPLTKDSIKELAQFKRLNEGKTEVYCYPLEN